MQKEKHASTLQGHQHIKDSIRKSKDKDPKNNQTEIIYHYQCPQISCPSAYIGESGRHWVKESRNTSRPLPPTPSQHHHSHPMDPEQFNIVHKEVNSHTWTIKEAMFILMQDPTLNRTLGSIIYLTYGTTSFMHHLLYGASLCANELHPPTFKPSTHLLVTPHLSSHCPYWQGAHTFMVSTHICPKHTPYTSNTPPHEIYNKSYSSTILVSFLHFIC